MVKRLFDLLVSATGLLIISPLLALIAVSILIETGFPVLYRQIRVGRNCETFRILKFRTMVNGAEAHGRLTVSGDSRVTSLGRYLRRYKLDELPQLINVLRGEMSLVGPRPEVPEFVEHYTPDDKMIVLSVRPGITDNSSIEFRDESALLSGSEDPRTRYIEQIMPVKLALYRDYVANRSMAGDIAIILKTVRAIW